MTPRRAWLRPLLTAAVLVLALDVVLILVTGGYVLRAFGLTLEGRRLFPPTILLLAVALIGRFVSHRARASESRFAQGVATTIFLACLIVYLANGRTISAGDTLPARYLPLSILRQGNFDLDEFAFLSDANKFPNPHFIKFVRGHVVSEYPVGSALLALPFYVPAALGPIAPEHSLVEELEKLSAATIVALSAALVYLSARRLTTLGDAVVITAVYALGTSSLSESSQALWQHGASQLALAAAFYCLVRGRREVRWVALAGFALAFAVISRPSDVLVALSLGLFVLIHDRRHLWAFLLGGVLPIGFQLWYNATYFGNPFRVQFFASVAMAVQYISGSRGPWSSSAWDGLAGILLSPGRGLFIYSPVVLLSLLGLATAWRRGGDLLLRCAGPGVILTLLLYSKWGYWWGGFSYGPRLLADLTPVLALALYPIGPLVRTSRALKTAFVALAVWSIGAHAIGAFADDRSWNWKGGASVDRFPARLWSWNDNQLINPPKDALRRAVIAARHLPTSRTAPALVSASYETAAPARVVIRCDRAVDVSVKATNVGRAAWLAHGTRDQGVVHLGWRWNAAGSSSPIAEGRVQLGVAVLPGQSHEFQASILPPPEPGTYLLEIGLVNEPARWFVERGSPPIRITVTVESGPTLPERTDAILALMEALRVPADDVPRIVMSMERPRFRQGDPLHLDLTATGGDRSRLFDAYLLLSGPAGARWFYDGRHLTRGPDCRWTPMAKAVDLERGERADGRVEVSSAGMMAGTYTWHLLLAEVDRYRIVAAAHTSFELTSEDASAPSVRP